MANDINNADKLIERILSDAREDAEKTAQTATEQTNHVFEIAEHDIWEIKLDTKLKSEKLNDSILERSRTNAALDSRKYALAAKRRVIDAAFVEAEKKLSALTGEKRDALLVSCAVKEADGGEAVLPSAADAAAFSRLLPEINKKLAAAGKAALTLGAEASIEGGFLLAGKGYEKNCSFSAMLREVKEREESRVSDILFE